MKRIILEPPGERSDAWKVVDALSGDAVMWHVIHLDFPYSGKTGKFYRIFMTDENGVDALCQWGPRPTLANPFYAKRGQFKSVSQAQARILLREKIDKGYTVVLEGSALAPKTATRDRLLATFFPERSTSEPPQFSMVSTPLWHGWRYW